MCDSSILTGMEFDIGDDESHILKKVCNRTGLINGKFERHDCRMTFPSRDKKSYLTQSVTVSVAQRYPAMSEFLKLRFKNR